MIKKRGSVDFLSARTQLICTPSPRTHRIEICSAECKLLTFERKYVTHSLHTLIYTWTVFVIFMRLISKYPLCFSK